MSFGKKRRSFFSFSFPSRLPFRFVPSPFREGGSLFLVCFVVRFPNTAKRTFSPAKKNAQKHTHTQKKNDTIQDREVDDPCEPFSILFPPFSRLIFSVSNSYREVPPLSILSLRTRLWFSFLIFTQFAAYSRPALTKRLSFSLHTHTHTHTHQVNRHTWKIERFGRWGFGRFARPHGLSTGGVAFSFEFFLLSCFFYKKKYVGSFSIFFLEKFRRVMFFFKVSLSLYGFFFSPGYFYLVILSSGFAFPLSSFDRVGGKRHSRWKPGKKPGKKEIPVGDQSPSSDLCWSRSFS